MNHVDKKLYSCPGCMPGNYYGRNTASADSRHGDGCGCDACRQRRNEGCECNPCGKKEKGEHCCNQSGSFDSSFALAMAYVPIQEWKGISAPCNGLQNGTVFGELVKPFCGAGRRKGV